MIPGEDYLTVVGEDLCALGDSFADVINDGVGSGKVGVMGGTPGNALSLGWQQCYLKATDPSIKNLGPADTYWANDVALQTVNGWLSTDPDIKGYAYEYADGLNTALQAYDDLNIPIDDPSRSRCVPTSRPCSARGRRWTIPTSTSGTRRAATSSHAWP